jgi:allantoate deiminase
LSDLLRQSAKKNQSEVIDLPSGAGHDAAVMGKICPMAMLFVRCKAGLSHHPDESITVEDTRIALSVFVDFVSLLGSL